jgi:hypothetical protein
MTSGPLLAKPDFSGSVVMSPFQGSKPVSNGQIVLGKMRIAAIATIAGWVLALPLVLAIAAWPAWRELCRNDEFRSLTQWLSAEPPGIWWPAGIMTITIVMTWHGMIEMMTTGLTGRPRFIGLITAGRMFWMSAPPCLALFCIRRPEVLLQATPWLYAGLASIILWKLVTTVRAFHQIRPGQFTTQNEFRKLLLLWMMVAVACAAGTFLCWWKQALPAPLLLLGAAWCWPGAPIARSVPNLASNRHR